MGGLLMRRQLMSASGPAPLPEWDLEWIAHDDGYPTTKGFTQAAGSSGTGTVSLTDYYVKINGKNNYDILYYLPYFTTKPSKLVCEAKMKIGTTEQAGCYLQAALSTSSSDVKNIRVRVAYTTNYKGIYIHDTGTSMSTATKIQNASLDTLYTLRIEIDGNYANVYIDNVLKASNVDLDTTTNTGAARHRVTIGGQGTGSSNAPVYLREFRMKVNRL